MKTITFFCSVFSRMSGRTKDEEGKEAIAVVQAGCFHCSYLERRYTYALFFASLQQGRQSKKPQLRSPTLLLPPLLGVCHTSFLLLSSLSLFFFLHRLLSASFHSAPLRSGKAQKESISSPSISTLLFLYASYHYH